ncbi:MAG: sporulation protein YqfD [Peptococcaceae bacterium]|nr:sporulation protein YqfD [Peptococcaceae bacterium]
MFLFRLVSFLFGYVNILVRGDNLEKFLNMAVSRGIYLWDIRRIGENEIFVKTRLSAVKPLRHIARKTKCRFSFKNREGLPFMASRMRKRKSLVIGVAVFLAGLYLLSSFVWFVDVRGNQRLPSEKILQAAAEAGLKFGSAKFMVDQQEVENHIRERIPEISYVGVSINGTKATIEIAEKTIIQSPKMQPAHIVAKKAGLVKEVLVLVGNPAVREGDTVVPGQVLISGIIPPPEEQNPGQAGDPGADRLTPPPPSPPAYVQARGVVRARVWYEGYAEVPLLEEGTRETGNSVSRVCIKIRDREIILSGAKETPFKNYRLERDVKKPPGWRNLSIPVELIIEKYLEMENYRKQISREEAAGIARRKALESARSGIQGQAKVVEEQSREITLKNPDNLVRFKARIETLEDIGTEKPINNLAP